MTGSDAFEGYSPKTNLLPRMISESRFSDTRGFSDTVTSRWNEVKVLDFNKLPSRNLLPEPKNKRVSGEKDDLHLQEGFKTAKSAGWVIGNQKESTEKLRRDWRQGIDFSKQTERLNWLQPHKTAGAGIEYKKAPMTTDRGGNTMISFDKTLPREQFLEDIDGEGKIQRKKRYFFMGSIKSVPQITSLLDFNNMTGRERAVNLRSGFTPLEKSPSLPREPQPYIRRENYHVLDVEDIMRENQKLAQ